MIEGRYLWRRRPSEGGRPGLSQAVLIPVGFNVEPTDLRTLLKPAMLQKLEEVTDELEASCEDLGQYNAHTADQGSPPLAVTQSTSTTTATLNGSDAEMPRETVTPNGFAPRIRNFRNSTVSI
jgi:hypothetical protein